MVVVCRKAFMHLAIKTTRLPRGEQPLPLERALNANDKVICTTFALRTT